jgi:hypothetical protein
MTLLTVLISMKRYFIIIIFFIGIMTAVCSYFHLHIKQAKEKQEQSLSRAMFLYNILKEDQEVLMRNEGCVISESLYLRDLENRKVNTDSLFSNGPYLVLFFSSQYCGDCVNYCLTQMKTFLSTNSTNKILMFASGYPLRDLFVFARSNQFDDKWFYSIETLNLPIEQSNMPFMFLIDEKLRPSHFFIPRREMPEQITNYLNVITERDLLFETL